MKLTRTDKKILDVLQRDSGVTNVELAERVGTGGRGLGEWAMETAKEIANKSPDAIRAAKRILNDAVAVDAAAGLMAESVEQQKLIGSPNQIEAVMSNLQKRAANYKD